MIVCVQYQANYFQEFEVPDGSTPEQIKALALLERSNIDFQDGSAEFWAPVMWEDTAGFKTWGLFDPE